MSVKRFGSMIGSQRRRKTVHVHSSGRTAGNRGARHALVGVEVDFHGGDPSAVQDLPRFDLGDDGRDGLPHVIGLQNEQRRR